MSAARKRLIVSADDFGMSAGVNRGVICAHREGILTGASLMVSGADAAGAIALARDNPRLAVGLHLVLVQGRAVLPNGDIPSLVGATGNFRQNPVWAGLRYFFTPRMRAELRREIRAQLERFRASGLPLSHIDGHLTIHMHPTVLSLLLEAAREFPIRAIRLPQEPLRPALRYSRAHLTRKLSEAAIFTLLSRFARARLAAAGVRHADRLFGLHQTGQVTEPYLTRVIEQLADGVTEVYCHAGIRDAESARWRPPAYNDEAELSALRSPGVRQALATHAVTLTNYHEI